jgi:hypothetical protein
MKMSDNLSLALAVFHAAFAFQGSFASPDSFVSLGNFASLGSFVSPDSFVFQDNFASPDSVFLLIPVSQDVKDYSKSFKKKPSGFFLKHSITVTLIPLPHGTGHQAVSLCKKDHLPMVSVSESIYIKKEALRLRFLLSILRLP